MSNFPASYDCASIEAVERLKAPFIRLTRHVASLLVTDQAVNHSRYRHVFHPRYRVTRSLEIKGYPIITLAGRVRRP